MRGLNPPREPTAAALSVCGCTGRFGLYRRGHIFYHGASRSHFWLFGTMLVSAVVVALLPWHTRAVVGEVKYWIAGMFLFAGICDIVPQLIWHGCGQQVSIDPKNKTLSIVGRDFTGELSWKQIVGLQICRQKVSGNSELNGYQLNLVWRAADGRLMRQCVLKHAIRGFVFRLGRRYESLFGFALIDHTRPSQSAGTGNRSQPVGSETIRKSAAAGSGR